MNALAIAPAVPSVADALQTAFLALVPRIETHARIYFRHVRCLDKRADLVADTVALAWTWYRRLVERGKDVAHFKMAFIFLVTRAVKSGRRLTGQEKAKDVLSPSAQKRHGFAVATLPSHSTLNGTPVEEALRDNTRSEVPDQVCFRIDFADWLASLTDRDRRIVMDMAVGERTRHLAHKYGVSPGRVSQKRREFQQDWTAFCGDSAAGSEQPATMSA